MNAQPAGLPGATLYWSGQEPSVYICKALGAGVVRGEGVGEPGKWEMYIDLSSGVLGITLRGGGVCLTLANLSKEMVNETG